MSLPLSSSCSFRTPSPARATSRKPRFAWGAAVATAIAAVASVVSPAGATPVDVFFNGPRPSADPNTAFGISQASALNANAAYGIPIISNATVRSPYSNTLSISQPKSSSLVITPNPPTSALNRVESNWRIKNSSHSVLTGASYLLFTHTDPYTVKRTLIDYADGNVGLKIDKDLGWAIVKIRSAGVDYYYPALLLDRSAANALAGNIAAGARVSGAIHYVVSEALIKAGKNYRLPELQLGFAQVVVPEPGTAMLLGLGLTLLAGRRRRA